MKRSKENSAFQCENCGANIKPLTNGSFRNHCPVCLYSKHMDNFPGDRASECKGLMKPVGLDYSGKKGYQIIHQCTKCNKVSRNKVAVDTNQEDNIIQFMTRIG
ncbi:RNHCP domain-containing protein [Sporosarcina sp. ACRSL]|uniref:RNHCP domain-containing protein n=1 Tax=Sporosarcina sp. ACRSL TaxID=2918215 RepID=UPI001EF4FB80|nr:RNHCP domain-containing protein [Sporosarcina sp. ACRSL]MCG7343956.1 RNHCP domain-containing protein [Sporosarcina sp. ACRSL]